MGAHFLCCGRKSSKERRPVGPPVSHLFLGGVVPLLGLVELQMHRFRTGESLPGGYCLALEVRL